MIIILLIILLILLFKIIKNNNNIFHPTNAYPYFLLIYVVPYTLLYLFKGNSVLEAFSVPIIGSEMNYLMIVFLLLTILSLLFYLMGVSFGLKLIGASSRLIHKGVNNMNVKKTALYFFIVSVLLFFYYYNSLGGISYYLDNLARRSEMGRGSGYLFSLFNFFIFFSTALFIVVLKFRQLPKKWFSVVFILSIIMLLVSGSRSVVVRYLIIMLIIFYFTFKPTINEIFSFKNKLKALAFFILMLVYVAVVPIIRTSTLEGSIDISESLVKASEELETVAKGNIYTEIQLNIIKLFERSDYWYGKSYLDLLYIPIPRSVNPNKPSADDGLYIFNLLSGNKIEVGTSYYSEDDFIVQSWPPSTFGAGYANFGQFGPLVLFFLLGIFIAIAYKKMINSNYQFVYVFLYAYIFWRLHLSNLLIVEVLTIIVLLLILTFLFPRLKSIHV